MTPHNRAWVLNRDVTALLDALDAKDVLISDLIELADNMVGDVKYTPMRLACFEAINALKARAAQ